MSGHICFHHFIYNKKISKDKTKYRCILCGKISISSLKKRKVNKNEKTI
jgi:hypothetical protein